MTFSRMRFTEPLFREQFSYLRDHTNKFNITNSAIPCKITSTLINTSSIKATFNSIMINAVTHRDAMRHVKKLIPMKHK